MIVNGIGTSASSQIASAQSVNKTASDLDVNDFFKLISAQLQNQSMYDTVDNAQFMSQMVQFSSLSQMNEMSKAFQSGFAVSLIGKQVSISTAGESGVQQVKTGTVDQVSFSGGVPYILVNGEFCKVSDVLDIGPQAAEAAPAE